MTDEHEGKPAPVTYDSTVPEPFVPVAEAPDPFVGSFAVHEENAQFDPERSAAVAEPEPKVQAKPRQPVEFHARDRFEAMTHIGKLGLLAATHIGIHEELEKSAHIGPVVVSVHEDGEQYHVQPFSFVRV